MAEVIKKPDMGKEETEKDTRRKYLEALVIGLGANIITARMSIEALMNNPAIYSSIDLTKHDSDQSNLLCYLGEWLLSGSYLRDRLRYWVGGTAIALLTQDLQSGCFTKLRDWVNKQSCGEGTKRFDAVLAGVDDKNLPR